MKTHLDSTKSRSSRLDTQVVAWRCEQLLDGGFPIELAAQLARDPRLDLHALIELVERGCRPQLAARILAPLEDETSASRFASNYGGTN